MSGPSSIIVRNDIHRETQNMIYLNVRGCFGTTFKIIWNIFHAFILRFINHIHFFGTCNSCNYIQYNWMRVHSRTFAIYLYVHSCTLTIYLCVHSCTFAIYLYVHSYTFAIYLCVHSCTFAIYLYVHSCTFAIYLCVHSCTFAIYLCVHSCTFAIYLYVHSCTFAIYLCVHSCTFAIYLFNTMYSCIQYTNTLFPYFYEQELSFYICIQT
jgi:hypothetical protein